MDYVGGWGGLVGGAQLYLGRGEHRAATALVRATHRGVCFSNAANVELAGFLDSAGSHI